MFGPEFDESIEEPAGEVEAKEDNSNAVNQKMDVHKRFRWAWEKRKTKLQHEYAMAGVALSVAPDVWEHAAQPDMVLDPKVREALEFIVKKLHQDPNPNKNTWLMNDNQIMDTIWIEFATFRNRRGAFGVAARWQGCHVRAGKFHLWHEKYSFILQKCWDLSIVGGTQKMLVSECASRTGRCM